MLQLGLVTFVILNGVAVYHSLQAARHLDPGTPSSGWLFWTRSMLAPRGVFTARGWRHRNLAIVLHTAAFVGFGVALLVS